MPKKILVISSISLTALLLYYLLGSETIITNQKTKVLVGKREFLVEVAQTTTEKERGLIGKEYLGESQGMLFIYKQPQQVTFWMKDMLIPIDIIWIENRRIKGFQENLLPDNGEKLYYSPGKIDYVLEIKAGEAARKGIRVGEKIFEQ